MTKEDRKVLISAFQKAIKSGAKMATMTSDFHSTSDLLNCIQKDFKTNEKYGIFKEMIIDFDTLTLVKHIKLA